MVSVFQTAVVVVSAFFFVAALGAMEKDRVWDLPLLGDELPSKHYSGYLKALKGSYLHYYFVEAIDVSPKTAPVVMWMNGGPGCSSMDGWGYELGPIHFKAYNSSGPVMELNPHTWAKHANLVFLEAPPGVGFSWREDGNYSISDSENAENNAAAVLDLFKTKFPEYVSNKFYVAGESYGGIYVPTLVDEILKHNADPSKTLKINLAGMLVGNGVTDEAIDEGITTSDLPFAYGHGIISKELYERGMTDCTADPKSAACAKDQGDFWQATQYNNIYGVYYHCFNPPTHSWKYIPSLRRRLRWMSAEAGFGDNLDAFIASVPPSPAGGEVPCIDSRVMETYLNREDVKRALHVQPTLDFHICYNIDYLSDRPNVIDVYWKMLAAKLPVLIYNGNIDMAVPYTGTEAWMATMNLNTTSAFHPWLFRDVSYNYGKQLGGYATGFENNTLWFVRVNGAGHMVPQFRPAAALEMFHLFISGEWF